MVRHYLLPIESIQDNILLLRNQKILLGTDLARLYGVETKVLMQAVKLTIRRFPSDFSQDREALQTREEKAALQMVQETATLPMWD